MKVVFQIVCPPSPCHYLPGETARMEYRQVSLLTEDEYLALMLDGWRRFGRVLFRPRCTACDACRPIRVPVDSFRPNRSQRRVRQANQGVVTIRIGTPAVTRAKLELYDRYHAFQNVAKDWPWHPPKDAAEFHSSFVDNPFPIEEWCYYLDERLLGVGYVDALPGGLSAIYFFYDPDDRDRSLGTWNVLSQLEAAARRGLPHVYLGYHVEGCGSMEYKAHFTPNERREPTGRWQTYRS